MQELTKLDKYKIFLLNTCSDIDGLPQSEGLKEFFKRDFSEPERSGEIFTLYEQMQIPELVLRLMDNRDFNKQPDSIRKEMVYSDYYPNQAKTSREIYLDDRRNLCQELHNKLCKYLNVPSTRVKFVDFKEETDYDHDLFQYYDTKDGNLYINSAMEYSNCEQTEMAERVMQGTFVHEVYYKLRKNFFRLDKLKGEERYLLLSALMKEFVVNSLNEEKCKGLSKEFKFNDAYSATQIYGILSTYNYLDDMFKKLKLEKIPAVSTLINTRIDFLSALIGTEEADEDNDEGLEPEIEYNEEDNSVEASMDVDEERAIIEEVLEFDYDLLYAVETSDLNMLTQGMFLDFFLEEMKECADEYYKFFGIEFDDSSFEEDYEIFRQENKALDEIEDVVEYALEETEENEQ